MRPSTYSRISESLRATSYSRVSADDLRERRSVGEQEADNVKNIEVLGWTLAESFVDNDRSASRFATKGRPGFAELVKHISGGGCDVLVLWESSRGSRTLTEWSTLLDLCRERGVFVHVVTHRHTYDLRIPRDWRTLAEEGVSNAYASEETRERVHRALESNARQGRPHGRITYGYEREYDSRGRLVRQTIREDQAAVIRDIAERIIEGQTTNSIVADLNRRSVPTPAKESMMRRAEELSASDMEEDQQDAERLALRALNLHWDLTGLAQVMTRPVHAALRVYQGEVVGTGDWPAILDVDTHRKVVAILTDPSRRTVRDGSVRHLLTNVAHCGECGGALKAQKARKRYAYMCKVAFCISVNALWLEPFVERAVVARLGNRDAVAFLVPQVDQGAVSRAAAEVAALQAQLAEAIASVGPNGISVATLARLEQSLAPRIADAQRRAVVPSVPPKVAALSALAGPGAAGRWQRLSISQRRSTVRMLVDVRVRRGRQGARTFDKSRLGPTRWVGDPLTWEEHGIV